MAFVIALFALLTCGCGSEFFAVPSGDVPDVDECTISVQTFKTDTLYTSDALPFSGRRKVPMSTWVPDGWHQFKGSLHIMSASWSVTWVTSLQMDVGHFLAVAVWDGEAWRVDSRVDLRPLLELDGDRLRLEAKVKASGIKPAGKPDVTIVVELALCGPGADEVSP